MIRGVIFDWFGVVAPLSLTNTVELVAEKLNKPVGNVEPVFLAMASELKRNRISEVEFWQGMETELNVTIPKQQRDIWANIHQVRPATDMLQLVTKIKENGYRVAVLSNTFPDTSQLIRRNGWYDLFDVTLTSSETGLAKPDRRAFNNCLERLTLKPNEALMIDDQLKNITTAKELGMKTLHIDTQKNVASQVRSFLLPANPSLV